MSSADDGYGWPRVYTARDAYAVVKPILDDLVDGLRAETSRLDDGKERRILIDAITKAQAAGERLAVDFGQPSPRGPERPALAEWLDALPDAEPPRPALPISPGNRKVPNSAAHWTAKGRAS